MLLICMYVNSFSFIPWFVSPRRPFLSSSCSSGRIGSGSTGVYMSAKYNPNVYDDASDSEHYSTAQEGLRYFREYAKRGMDRFMQNDLDGSILDFDRAMKSNSSQPLIQRGIALYCAGQYQNASQQLLKDIAILEGSKLFKASDLRIWLSATYNKLGQNENAVKALDHTSLTTTGLIEQRYVINCTMEFYAGEKTIEDMLSIIDDADERDVFGLRFFGNFYLGLYYDSVGDYDLAKTFMSFTRQSNRYPDKDMWYHLPRVLFSVRGWDEADEILS